MMSSRAEEEKEEESTRKASEDCGGNHVGFFLQNIIYIYINVNVWLLANPEKCETLRAVNVST